MTTAICGLDFGTSNSTIGIIKDGACQLVPLEGNKPIIRSAIFCDAELKRWVFGQEGITSYLEGCPGRLMMSLKSVLGSPLMEDETLIFNEFISYSQILGHFVNHLKVTAEQMAGHELNQVVLGRPVRFHDTDIDQDRLAQDTMQSMAEKLGFDEVSFQFEPIAAAMTYETTIKKEQLALIIDMGGGTSDFTVIRLRPNYFRADRTDDVLANAGIHIAGTDFDQRLSIKSVMPLLGMGTSMRGSSSDIELPTSYYYDLTAWHTINQLYKPTTLAHIRQLQVTAHHKDLVGRLINVLKERSGHHILHAVETTKQQLSTEESTLLDVQFIEDELTMLVSQASFNDAIEGQVNQITHKINETIKLANVSHDDISAIFYTGGSTKIPMIRNRINAMFPKAEIVQGDAFGSVGMGLTLEAERRANE